jgi:hypothetical protein
MPPRHSTTGLNREIGRLRTAIRNVWSAALSQARNESDRMARGIEASVYDLGEVDLVGFPIDERDASSGQKSK